MIVRRNFLIGSVGLLALPSAASMFGSSAAQESTPSDASVTYRVGRSVYITADGTGDSTSWENAAPLSAITDIFPLMQPGSTLYLSADVPFNVDQSIVLSGGGSRSAPITIVGSSRDDLPQPATLRGSRKPWIEAVSIEGAVDAADFGGEAIFRIGPSTGHVTFRQLHIENAGAVVDMSGVRSAGIVLEDVSFLNIRDGIYTDGDTAVDDVVLRRFSGRGFSKKAVRFHGNCANWLIEDCDFDSAWQFGDNFAVGIECNDQAHDLRVVGGSCSNCMDTQGGDPDKYWNADGVASERGNYNIAIQNHRSSGNTDAGYDLKSETTVAQNCVSEDNKRNFRLWGGIGITPMQLIDCSSLNPHKRGGSGGPHHLWLSGAGDIEDGACSVLASGGRLTGSEPDFAIHVDGGNAAVHLVDVDTSTIGNDKLFETTIGSSKLIVGSQGDSGISKLVSRPALSVVEGTTTSIRLEADGDASWRIVSADPVLTVQLSGDQLSITSTTLGGGQDLVVQARDRTGQAMQFAIAVDVVSNPVGEGAVLSTTFASANNKAKIVDETGMNTIKVSPEAKVEDGSFIFGGKDSYFEVEGSPNFAFEGPFTISATLAIDRDRTELPADIVTVWKTSAHKRSFRLGLSDAGRLAFYWSTDGRSDDENVILGPELPGNRNHDIVVDRGASGFVRLYVDGAMVAKSSQTVGALYASNAPLRVSGRVGNDKMAYGRLQSLLVLNGRALCDNDDGCHVN